MFHEDHPRRDHASTSGDALGLVEHRHLCPVQEQCHQLRCPSGPRLHHRFARQNQVVPFVSECERNAVTTSDDTTRFRVHIDETDYGGYFGGAPQFTKNSDSLRDFYRDAVANGAKDTCVFDSRGKLQ